MSRLFRCCFVILIVVFAVTGWCAAAEFTADIMMRNGKIRNTGKVYVKATKFRVDVAGSTSKLTEIGENGSDVIRYVHHADKQYWDERSRPLYNIVDDKLLLLTADKKVVGTEKVQGYVCKKIVYTFHNKREGKEIRWYCPKLGAPIKFVSTGGGYTLVREFINIKECKISDSVFRTPKGYVKRR